MIEMTTGRWLVYNKGVKATMSVLERNMTIFIAAVYINAFAFSP